MDSLKELQSLKTYTPFFAKFFYFLAGLPWFTVFQEKSFGLAVFIMCVFLSLPCLIVAQTIHHFSNRGIQRKRDDIAKKVLEEIKLNRRMRFFVFLRPFAVTGKMSVKDPNIFETESPKDIEEKLVNSILRWGPLISLGKQFEGIGSSRFETSEDEWRDRVVDYISRASLIFIVPGYQEGTKWEMEKILKGKHIYKTIFITPVGESFSFNAEDHWKKTREDWEKSFNISLPDFVPSSLFKIDPISKAIKFLPNVLDKYDGEKNSEDLFKIFNFEKN